MYFITEFINRKVIVWNGHMFRLQAVMSEDEHGVRKVESGGTHKGQGRTKYFEIIISEQEHTSTVHLQGAGREGDDLIIPGDTSDVIQYHDLFFTDDHELVPNMGVPRYASVAESPRRMHWELIHDELRRRRFSLIVIDGRLVWVGSSQGGCQVRPVVEPGLSSLYIHPFNSTDDYDDIVVSKWDGTLWVVGPQVFATTHEEALHLQEILLRRNLTLDKSYVSPAKRKLMEERVRAILNRHASIVYNLLSQMTLAEPPTAEFLAEQIKKSAGAEIRALRPRHLAESTMEALVKEWIAAQ